MRRGPLHHVAMAAGMLLGLALLRFQLDWLGVEGCGTWLALSALAGPLSLLELGLGAALSRCLVTQRDEGALYATAFFLYLLVGVAVLAAGAGLACVAGPLLHLGPGSGEARRVMLLLSLNVCASLLLCPARRLLLSRGREDLGAALTLLRHVLYALLVVTALRCGGRLPALAACGLVADLGCGLVLLRCARRVGGPGRGWLGAPEPRVARALLQGSPAVVGLCAGVQILRGAALPLLLRGLGPVAVAVYAPAERLCALLILLAGQVGTALRAHGLVRLTRLSLALLLPPLGLLVCLAGPLCGLWLRDPARAAQGALCLRLLAVGVAGLLLGLGASLGAYADRRVRRGHALLRLFVGLCALPLCWAGIRRWGAPGAALCIGLAGALCDAALAPLLLGPAIGLRPFSYYRAVLRRLGPCLAGLGALGTLLRLCVPAGPVWTVLGALAALGLGWLLTGLFYLDPTERAALAWPAPAHLPLERS